MESRNEQLPNALFKQKFHRFLERTKGSNYNKSAIIYHLIAESEEPKNAFRYFLENADYIDSSDEEEADEYFTPQQFNKYKNEYTDLVDGLLNKLVMCHYDKDQFYDKLWESVIDSDILFDTEAVKIFALGKIWSDARIPYFCVKNGIKMSNEEFMDIIKKRKELIQEAGFILSCKYEQRTESSSILLDVIDRCDNDKEKAVIMANIIELVENRAFFHLINNN